MESHTSHALRIGATLLGLAGCGGASHVRDQDLSALRHEEAAENHDTAAAVQSAQYDPAARAERERCSPGTGRATVMETCWTSAVNPTAPHQREAAQQRRMAADHRAASQALRDAEDRACVGVREVDRDESPFAHREDIASVAPLMEPATPSAAQRVVGSVVTFRPLPGLSVPWLQRVIDCHLARNAALGHAGEGMTFCPLVPSGVTARVTASGTGFAVALHAADAATLVELQRRTAQLTPPTNDPLPNSPVSAR